MAEYADLHGPACSVGRTGVCWDSAQQESYWATLKVEFYNRCSRPTSAQAMLAVVDWIERVHNRRRRHSALNMLSQVRFEQLHRQPAGGSRPMCGQGRRNSTGARHCQIVMYSPAPAENRLSVAIEAGEKIPYERADRGVGPR
jgi:putative transposase